MQAAISPPKKGTAFLLSTWMHLDGVHFEMLLYLDPDSLIHPFCKNKKYKQNM